MPRDCGSGLGGGPVSLLTAGGPQLLPDGLGIARPVLQVSTAEVEDLMSQGHKQQSQNGKPGL